MNAMDLDERRAGREECRLAYGLHEQFGRVCSRAGGDAICGECIGDLDAPILGFRRRGDLRAAECGEGRGAATGVAENTIRPLSDDPGASLGHPVSARRTA